MKKSQCFIRGICLHGRILGNIPILSNPILLFSVKPLLSLEKKTVFFKALMDECRDRFQEHSVFSLRYWWHTLDYMHQAHKEITACPQQFVRSWLLH